MKILRDTIGRYRQSQIWERRFKMPTMVIKIVVIMYALIGLGATILIIKNESAKLYNELTHAKYITIESNDPEIENGKGNDPGENESIESDPVSCNDWAEVWGAEYQVNESLLKKIIQSESSNDETAEHGISTAAGCSQFVIGTWRIRGKELWGDEFYSKNIYSPKDNVQLLVWTISKYGTADWDASRNVWSK